MLSNSAIKGNKQLDLSKLYNALGYAMTCILLGSITAFLCYCLAITLISIFY
jgi:hypothetical protein